MVAVGAVVAIMPPNELDTKRKPSNERREDSLSWIVGACNLLRFPSFALARAGLPGVRGGGAAVACIHGGAPMSRMSQDRAFDLLKEMLDPAQRWWWTAYGLITLTTMARTPEGRFWAEVYERLASGGRR